jgi:hypothetical protein
LFELHDDRGARTLNTDSDDPASIGPALVVITKRAQKLQAERATGVLTLSFSDGAKLVGPGDRKYESWEGRGDDGLWWIGGPSGTEIWGGSAPRLDSSEVPER